MESSSLSDTTQPSHPSSAQPSHPSSAQQTLPRITSVTSIRNQQLMASRPLVGGPSQQFHEDPSMPPAWDIPGPSREQHVPPHMEQFMMASHSQAVPPPMPVGISRHGEPPVVGAAGGGEMVEDNLEEGEVMVSEDILRAMPVATEMRDLTFEDLEVGGIDVSSKLILFQYQ